uniref:PAT complex subunit Asterix n=1 Tax=Gouania willdenowi TaxID=441366 RepID=A0A8C5DEF7_GOUWI
MHLCCTELLCVILYIFFCLNSILQRYLVYCSFSSSLAAVLVNLTNVTLEDPTPDYMNLLGMIFSMCGLMLKLKWCAWIAVYCSFISFANSRSSEDTKQMMSSFMLSISAVVMSYLQNPQPMSPPW